MKSRASPPEFAFHHRRAGGDRKLRQVWPIAAVNRVHRIEHCNMHDGHGPVSHRRHHPRLNEGDGFLVPIGHHIRRRGGDWGHEACGKQQPRSIEGHGSSPRCATGVAELRARGPIAARCPQVMKSRRLMRNMGICSPVTTLGLPTLSLPQASQQVFGPDLNRSESRGAPRRLHAPNQ